MDPAVLIVIAVAVALAAINILKGKYGLFALGLLCPHLVWTAGACMLAKPNSFWARRFYDDEKMADAVARQRRREKQFWNRPLGRSTTT